MTEEPFWAASPDCRVCGRPSVPGSYLCEPCRRLMGRVETRKDPSGRGRPVDRQARLVAMKEQWDPEIEAFRCHYTGIPLDAAHGTRRHATWEHLVPGDESSVVLAAALINRMKSDMTDAEFKTMVSALAGCFEGTPFEGEAFPPDP